MKDRPPRDTLEVRVADFGPIVEARVDLRPLTVFVGPSNTGKSYLAILIYALHRHFSAGFRHWRVFEERPELPRKTVNTLAAFAKRTAEDMAKPGFGGRVVLPGGITDAVRTAIKSHGDRLALEIVRCFGIRDLRGLIRKGSHDFANVVLRKRLPDDSGMAEHRLLLGGRDAEYTATLSEDMAIPITERDEITLDLGSFGNEPTRVAEPGEPDREWRLTQLLINLTDHILPYVLGPLHLDGYYLPADRTGVMHAHSAVVSATIGSAAMTGLRPAARTPMLSGVLADFLQQLIELDRPSRRNVSRLYWARAPRQDLAKSIEDAVLGGHVLVNRSEVTGYPHFAYRPKGWKDDLPLMNTSSMVSELAPVVLYLRHRVGPDSVLMIEEPESHLHPAMQVEFTRQLALLVRAGVRVIVTTHSEWVLEELANIVRRSALSDAGGKKAADAKVALRPEDVGAWMFKPKRRPRGSVVEEVKLDEETGLYPTDYDAVSEALYNESASIFNRIQDSNPR